MIRRYSVRLAAFASRERLARSSSMPRWCAAAAARARRRRPRRPPDVRQRLERAERRRRRSRARTPAPPPRSGRSPGRDGDRAQHRRLARRRSCRRPAWWPSVSGSKNIGSCSCRSGMSASPSGISPSPSSGSAARSTVVGELVEPRAGAARGCRAATAAADERARPCRFWSFGPRSLVVRVRLGRRVALPDHGRAEPQLGDPHLGRHRRSSLVQPPAYADWNGTSRPGPVFAMPRPGIDGSNECRRRVADDVVRVGLIRHAQRDPEVGVRPQVVLDDARRALRRHDQVDAERPAALGDVDDAVDELGHLARERRELVDDEHEGRRGLGVAGASRARGGPSPSCG